MPDRLRDLIEAERETLIARYVALMQGSSEHYATLPAEMIRPNVERSLSLLVTLHREPEDEEARAYIRSLCEQRLPRGFRLTEVLNAIFLLNGVMVPLLREHLGTGPDTDEAEDQLCAALQRLALLWADGYVELQEEILLRREKAVRALSTPVIQVWHGILTLPLIGDVDDMRSRQITEDLLYKVIHTQSSVVLIDITGIGNINTNVIAQLLRTVHCAELLGTSCWIVGVSPEVANTIVTLGIDLSRVVTHATLQQGLDHAFHQLGLRVCEGPA